MTTAEHRRISIHALTAIGIMAAMVYVVTLFRFPLLGSKVHFANAVCLLAGLLLGPVNGGLAAGIGSGLYDAIAGGYDPVNVAITIVSKFAMSWVCGMVCRHGKDRDSFPLTIAAGIAGALSYVCLYMLKTFIFQRFVYGFPPDAVWATMLSKLPASLINAGVAIIAAPLFFRAVYPALGHAGLLERIR